MTRWPTKPLGEIAEVRWGNTSLTKASYVAEGFAAFSATGEDGFLPSYEHEEAGIVLSAIGANCGKCFLAKGRWTAIKNTITITSPAEELCTIRYLFYFLNNVDLWPKRGGGQPFISQGDARKVIVPVAPLAEQGRIVKLLDEADELRKLRAQADRRTADLIPALFHEMFGEVDSNSKKWPMVRFAEIGESRLGKMLDAKQQTGQYKRLYLRNANVQWNRLDLGDMLEMDFSESDRKEFRLRYGDLLICEGGEVGRAAIWRDELPECYFQKALHRVRLHPSKAIPEFVLHLLQAIATTNGFRDYVGSATIPHLTGVKLASIRIPLPPLPLQKKFAARVSDIRAMQAEQATSRRRLDDLFQSMLHRAFQGDL